MNWDLCCVFDDELMCLFQWLVVVVCIVFNLIDGFDVLVMVFIVFLVVVEWNFGGVEIGLLFSVGFFGMVVGLLFIVFWVDCWGCCLLIFVCLVLLGLGMFVLVLSQVVW